MTAPLPTTMSGSYKESGMVAHGAQFIERAKPLSEKLVEMFTSKMPSIGGAIDVMVVRQPDGTFKSSPFHVRFPAWLFRPRHREVYVEVNGVRTPVVMALGRTGNAYFVERATDIDPNETAVDEDDAASLTGMMSPRAFGVGEYDSGDEGPRVLPRDYSAAVQHAAMDVQEAAARLGGQGAGESLLVHPFGTSPPTGYTPPSGYTLPIGNRYTGTASSPSLGVTPTGTSVPARPQNAPLVPPLVLPGTEGSRDAEGLSPRIRVAPLTYDDVRRGERLVLPSQSPRPGAHASVATSQAGDIAARTSGGLSLPPTPQPGTALGPRESSATAGGLSESLTRRTLQCTAQMLEMELQHERALETRACLRGSSEGGADVAPGGLSIELRGATEGTAGERVREGWGEERAAMRAAQETSDASSVTVARYAQPFVEEAERAEGGAGAGGGESMPLGTGPRGPAWHKRDQSMGAESMKSMESADAGVRQSLDESVRVSQGEKALTADRAGPRDWEEGGFRGEEGEEEGRWRFWPFASSGGVGRRAGRERPEASGSGRESEGTAEGGRFVKTMTPTSEDLAAMGLKPGQNEVVFVCQRTEMRAYLYVYDWDAKLVVSDIDGTITRSDLMGHVMTAVGRDWTHRGIAELFRGVVRNGYEMMYLSSRSISQAASTRDFLHNLKQPGEAAGRDGLHSMPLGPVILSPDGLFRSVTREIILRRPHEFKIAALTNIRRLFPAHWNPFYAGFGNRNTDEVSYIHVGVPKGRVFTINPRGEIYQLTSAAKTTFSSLSAIREHVDVVFPPIAAGPVAPSSHDSPEGKDKPADVVTVASTAAAGVLDEFSDLMYWRMTIVESLGASPADARGLGATDADVAEPSGATLAAGSEGRASPTALDANGPQLLPGTASATGVAVGRVPSLGSSRG